MLIDLVNQYRSRGRPLHEAIVEGAAQRLRPILMTAIATIFALLPMAGADRRRRVHLPAAGRRGDRGSGQLDDPDPRARPGAVPAGRAGRVCTPDGAGVPARLTLLDHDGRTSAAVRASADGSFGVTRVRAGDHRLVVVPAVGEPASYRVTVPASGTPRCELTLPALREQAHARTRHAAP